jgi:peroxiredoxin
MAGQMRQKNLQVAGIVIAIVFAVLIIWAIVGREGPSEEPLREPVPSESPTESTNEPAVTDTELFAGPKMSLDDVIKAAKTWFPSVTSWSGKPAPDFTLTDIAGKQHRLSDYRGKNVMIIFWAVWCSPCLMEVPGLIELRNTISEDKLAMLAISYIGPRNTTEMVKNFVAEKAINYTVISTSASEMPEPYNLVNAIPSSFFIDPQGRIKLITSGLLSSNDAKAILQAE